MMKRIPKGTLKVTTSELDGLPAHEKSKRPQFQKKGLPSAKTPKGIRSVASPAITRIQDDPPAVVSPTSPPGSTFSQTSSHSFQFLRRPFGGATSLHIRKSSSATKRLQQINTCGSSDTSSNSSGMLLGIAAPPSTLAVELIDPADDSLENNVSNETIQMDEGQVCVSQGLCGSPPTSGDPSDWLNGHSSSPSVHTHLLGITRPSYKRSRFETGEMPSDEDELAKLYEEQESEIVFECSPDSASSKRDKFTLFEQSWLSDSDEDIQLEREQRSPGHHRQGAVKRQISPEHRRPEMATRVQARKVSTSSTPEEARSPSSTRTRSSHLPIREESSQSRSPVSIAKDAGVTKGSQVEDARANLADPSESVKIFVLLLQPSDKIFELIQLTYPREGTTLGSILDMIPGNATEAVLASQAYVGITRPKKRSPDFCDTTLSVSDSLVSSSNYHSIGLQHGEIVVALPKGFSHHELVRLAKKILSNARIQSLLERSSAKIGKKLKTVSPVVKQGNLERQGKKEHEESMMRAIVVASVANAAVQRPAKQAPIPQKASKEDLVSQSRSLHRLQEGGPSSFAPFPSLSLRQRQAIKGIAKLSSASSVSSSSSHSAASRTRRCATAGVSKMGSESILGTHSQPFSSSASVSSTSDASELAAIPKKSIDSLEIKKRSDDVLILRRFDRTKVSDYPRASPLAAMQSEPLQSKTSDAQCLQRGPKTPRSTLVASSAASVASSSSHTSSTARYSPPIIKATRGSVQAARSVASECSSADRSVRSYLSRRSARSHVPRPESFASFTQRSVYGSTSRVHRQRQRAAFGSTLAWGLALLCMTMILRYYTDPTGYQAVALHRNYDQPLGLLGGLQLFLLMHMLIKFQQSYLSGRVAATVGNQTRLHTPSAYRGGRSTPLLHRQSGTNR